MAGLYSGALAASSGNRKGCHCAPCVWVTSTAIVSGISAALLGAVFVPAKKVLASTLFACCEPFIIIPPAESCLKLVSNATVTNITDFCTTQLPSQITSNNVGVVVSATLLGVSALISVGITASVVYRNCIRRDYVSFL